MEKLAKDLKALGSDTRAFNPDGPDAAILEAFPNPREEFLKDMPEDLRAGVRETSGLHIHIECPEFTSLCPKTGQPDFATIQIYYTPDKLCVESKSLKLYLFSFRNHGEFHEACVMRIGTDLVKLLRPQAIRVVGQFTPRGGIPFHPTFEYYKPFDPVEAFDLSEIKGAMNSANEGESKGE